MNVKLIIDSREENLDCLWRPEMGLSSSRTGRRSTKYKLIAEKEILKTVLSLTYEDCVRELKQDDKITGTSDFFGKAGYPALEELLNQPELLSEIVTTYFWDELLDAVLKPDRRSVKTYCIDEVTSVSLNNEGLVIEGTCYEF